MKSFAKDAGTEADSNKLFFCILCHILQKINYYVNIKFDKIDSI